MNSIESQKDNIAKISADIKEHEANPVLAYFGKELGTAKLVRDDRNFRIFVKEVEDSKSGKATVVEMHVFVSDGGKEFSLVRGHTYLPKFVLENKDVYWILQNKLSNVLSKNPEYPYGVEVDMEYVPKKYRIRMNYWSEVNSKSAEERVIGWAKTLNNFKNSMIKDLRLEVNTLAFLESIAWNLKLEYIDSHQPHLV